MALVNFVQLIGGLKAIASQVMTNFNRIGTEINGNLGKEHMRDGGISEPKLEDGASPGVFTGPTSLIPAAGFVIEGLDYASASGLVATFNSGKAFALKTSVDPDRQVYVSKSPSFTATLSASSDNYIDLRGDGQVINAPVPNGGTVPDLTEDCTRIAKVVTDASSVTSDTDLRSLTLSPSTDGFNFVLNGNMESWRDGTSSAPTRWALVGASATVAQDTTNFKYGIFSAGVTRVGTDCYLQQVVDTNNGYGPIAAWQGKTITVGAWVRATVADRARVAINDGVGTSNSSYHTGDSTFRFLSVTRTIDSSATALNIRLVVDTGDTTAQFDGVTLARGSAALTDFTPAGPGTIIQVARTRTGAVATTTSAIPVDDTIPQNTEGAEFMTLSITPHDANSFLLVEVTLIADAATGLNTLVAALFRDSTADAIAAAHVCTPNSANKQVTIHFLSSLENSNAAASTTFKVRGGISGSVTMTFNGTNTTRNYGGVMASGITIYEIIK